MTSPAPELNLSDYANRLPGSPVREILHVSQQPGMISFAGGLPDAAVMPEMPVLDNLAAISQYGTSDGESSLIKELVKWLGEEGLPCSEEQVIITSGSQQGLDLAARILVDAGSDVLVEDPTYLAMLQVLRGLGANLVPFTLDEQGVDLAGLESLLQTRKPRMIYLIPTFQNPTGYSYSEQERRAVAELIDRYDVTLVEDDPYRVLNYDNAFTRPVSSYLTSAKWLYMGSFSKMLWPGLRTGFVIAHPELYPWILRAKQATDLHSNRLGQAIIGQFLKEGRLPDHVAKLKAHYQKKRDYMQKLLQQYLPDSVRWQLPAGGMFFWLTLEQDTRSVLQDGIEAGVVALPGTPFAVEKSADNTLRLSFSQMTPEDMEEGVKRLAGVLAR
ncbi:aminotransferase-like domain-containing protein [Oceanospirillum sediminis]|uniref:PLP-dependent aminotransferase family protein n=1 Tax=Oceanospirillum sediminis TaxID=2760088 RepID=A0A839INC1_9GAMM|nr:PLP-dependent aminotransferase family protein [Oceanospirillum sediminis]MBB1486012.1 PLP-dependent aminotransferase family protein [Oceanospirillum sediminis]